MFDHAQNHIFGFVDTGINVNCPERQEILQKFPVPTFRENNAIHTASFGTEVVTTVLITDCELATTSTGEPMLKMRVHDSYGSYPAQIFSRPGIDLKQIKEEIIDKYKLIEITANVSEFPRGSGNKTLQLKNLSVDTDKKRSPDAYLSYLPKCRANIEDLVVEMYLILDKIENPTYKTIAMEGLRTYWNKFVISPAARRHHHAYIHGLVEHTWGLLRLAYFLTSASNKDVVSTSSVLYARIVDFALKEIKKYKETGTESKYADALRSIAGHMYWIIENMAKQMVKQGSREVDRDFILAAVIWHDMGKIYEYTTEGKIDRDPMYGILEHRVIGPMMFQQFCKEQDIELSEKDYWHFLHILASHHGKVEWGSPTMPQTVEGWFVHLVDFLDAQLQGTND